MVRVVLSLVLSVAFLLLGTGIASAQPGPEFKLGFKALAELIPDRVGEPLEDEHWGLNGDSLQQTTGGLLVWRKADNRTAFTDGARTWIVGPGGLQLRANSERFDWESLDRAAGQPVSRTDGQYLAAAPSGPPDISVGPSRKPSATDPQGLSGGFDAAAEGLALELINGGRKRHGLAPLVMDERVRKVARLHAQDMAARGYFAHETPEGRTPSARLADAGIPRTWSAENLGSVASDRINDDIRAIHRAMMDEIPPDDGHRRNILDGKLRRVGIGVYVDRNGEVYYVADFTD